MTLFKMENRRNFGFSAENPTGTKGGGTRAKDCEKLSPCIQIQPGETVTLCDTDGPGMVTHMWFTGYVDTRLFCESTGKTMNSRPWKHRFRHFSVARMTRIFLTATAITRF